MLQLSLLARSLNNCLCHSSAILMHAQSFPQFCHCLIRQGNSMVQRAGSSRLQYVLLIRSAPASVGVPYEACCQKRRKLRAGTPGSSAHSCACCSSDKLISSRRGRSTDASAAALKGFRDGKCSRKASIGLSASPNTAGSVPADAMHALHFQCCLQTALSESKSFEQCTDSAGHAWKLAHYQGCFLRLLRHARLRQWLSAHMLLVSAVQHLDTHPLHSTSLHNAGARLLPKNNSST